MNLKNNPTALKLAMLIQAADPQKTYVLWVDYDGEVKLSGVAPYKSPADFCVSHRHQMQVRFATFLPCPRHSDLGPQAAQDIRWVAMLFNTLLHKWDAAHGIPAAQRHPTTANPVLEIVSENTRSIQLSAVA